MESVIKVREEWHLLNHPFYRAWMAGQLQPATLRDYAQQYFHHVEAFPQYLKNAINLCEDPTQRQILRMNLADEEGCTHGTSHPELWLRFAEGLGVPRTAVVEVKLREGIQGVVRTFTESSSRSVPSALGSLFAYESQVPEIAQSKIEGLKNQFGVVDTRTLEFFEVHRLADVEHREALEHCLDLLTPEEVGEAQRAADESCRALWDFLSDVYAFNGHGSVYPPSSFSEATGSRDLSTGLAGDEA